MQGRDRELLVVDPARRATLWPTLGRPGAVVRDGEVVGTWRPRASGRSLHIAVDPWRTWDTGTRDAVEEEAARLARTRGLRLAGVAGDSR